MNEGKEEGTKEWREEGRKEQTHSILDVDNPGYERDFMSTVHLEYDCCQELKMKFNISTIILNTSFKHIMSHLDDLKIASCRISDVENTIREQEWKRMHTSSQTRILLLFTFA